MPSTPVVITVFPNRHARPAQSETLTFTTHDELFAWLRQQAQTFQTEGWQGDKPDITLFTSALFAPGSLSKEAECVTGYGNTAILDFDNICVEDFATVLDKFRTDNRKFYCYSTWSHGMLKPGHAGPIATRVVVPLSRAVDKDEWEDLFAGLQDYCNGLLDKSNKAAGRSFYVPMNRSTGELNSIDYAFAGTEDFQVEDLLTRGRRVRKRNKRLDGSMLPSQDLEIRQVLKYDVADLASKLMKSPSARSKQTSKTLRKMISEDDLIYAPAGERDNWLQRIASALAFEYPKAIPDRENVEVLFGKSLRARAKAHLKEETYDSDVDSLLEKWLRHLAKVNQKMQEDEQSSEVELETRCRAAWKTVGIIRSTTYSLDELYDMARDRGITLEAARMQWIVRVQDTYFLYVNGAYLSVSGSSLVDSARELLAPAMGAGGVELRLGQGRGRDKTERELMQEYGTTARSHVLDGSAQATVFDTDSGEMVEACSPLRAFEPEFLPQIDRWLRVMFNETYDEGNTWLATLMMLERPAPMLALVGASQAGKSQLAEGISKLWRVRGGPCTASASIHQFNQARRSTPFIFADEDAPKEFKEANYIKRLIQSMDAELNSKGKAQVPIQGAVRVLMAANSENIINFKSACSVADLNALNSRMIVARVPEEAARVFEEGGGAGGAGAFQNLLVEQEGLARHITFLSQNLSAQKQEAFAKNWRTGSGGYGLVQSQALKNGINEKMLMWFVKFLRGRKALPGVLGKYFFDDDTLFVQSRIIHETWSAMYEKVPVPDASHIKEALDIVAPLITRKDGEVYAGVTKLSLIAWAESIQFASATEITKLFDDGAALDTTSLTGTLGQVLDLTQLAYRKALKS